MSGPKLRSFPKTDLKGKRIGRLQVIEFIGYLEDDKKRRHPTWKCLCDCGKEKVLRHCILTSRKQQSCGCLLDEFRKNILPSKARARNSKPFGVAAKNDLINSYKQRAKLKKLQFSLSLEEFVVLTSENCSYCGRPPENSLRGKGKKQVNGEYKYNGLDRIDNSKGYISDNVVTCCEICNKARRDLTIEEFKDWMLKLLKYQFPTVAEALGWK